MNSIAHEGVDHTVCGHRWGMRMQANRYRQKPERRVKITRKEKTEEDTTAKMAWHGTESDQKGEAEERYDMRATIIWEKMRLIYRDAPCACGLVRAAVPWL